VNKTALEELRTEITALKKEIKNNAAYRAKYRHLQKEQGELTRKYIES
jgi:hypothetical protein